jgi:hypothetical protein
VKYVVELARALAMMPGVYRVDLFTRQVSSPDVDWSYGEPTEMLTSGSNFGEGMGESAGAYRVGQGTSISRKRHCGLTSKSLSMALSHIS